MKQNQSDPYRACRDTFMKTLYHFDAPGQSLIIDETTGRLYLRKELVYYDPSVYDFLMHHQNPHLVRIYDAWQEGDKFVVLEQYLQGVTLEVYLAENDVSLGERQRIAREVCEALEALHSAEPPIVHRDVKPENIMITDSGRAVLMDYDASKREKPSQSRDTVLLGTRETAAPEQYGFGASSVRTDVYGMGKLVDTLLGDHRAYRPVIRKATKLDPEKRYRSVADLSRALGMIDRTFEDPSRHFWPRVFWTAFCVVIAFALSRMMDFDTAVPMAGTVMQIGVFIAFLSSIEIGFNWTGLFWHLPLVKKGRASPWRRAVEKTAYGFLFFVGVVIVFIILLMCIYGEKF
ncbi:MAG: serine/threonine protein kinase [Pseudoramibacter sp.]